MTKLNILKAETLFSSELEGGTTKPILVGCAVDGEIKSYVTKIFKVQTMQQYNAVAYEFLGSALASEFELNTPETALIDLTKEFMEGLKRNDPALYKDLLAKDKRLKFGSQFKTPHFSYSSALSRNYLAYYDIESIYAFDLMIHNIDRTTHKPNLFFSDKSCYLIDHEQCLMQNEFMIDQLIKGRVMYSFKRHIFYNYLKASKNKNETFNTFQQYLQNLNLNNFKNVYADLQYVGHEIENFEIIYDYLCYIRGNASKFVETLRQTIQ